LLVYAEGYSYREAADVFGAAEIKAECAAYVADAKERYKPFIDAIWKSRRKTQPNPFTEQAMRGIVTTLAGVVTFTHFTCQPPRSPSVRSGDVVLDLGEWQSALEGSIDRERSNCVTLLQDRYEDGRTFDGLRGRAPQIGHRQRCVVWNDRVTISFRANALNCRGIVGAGNPGPCSKPTARASSASCGPRPGGNPYEKPQKSSCAQRHP
jgi:hypothetical protein